MHTSVTISGEPRSRLFDILESWAGTPRMANQSRKQAGTNCSGFVAGVMEELTGVVLTKVPEDKTLLHRNTAEATFRAFLKAYPAEVLEGAAVEPGDVLVVGLESGGLEHAMFVGNKYLWHCGHKGVVKTGCILQGGYVVKKILRYFDKGGW